MSRMVCASTLAGLFLTLTSHAVFAQQARVDAEGVYGGAWFLDETAIPHTIGGGALRWRVTPRVGIGPEATYMVGPGRDRDFTLTGNVTFDIRPAGVTPFLTAGAGLFHHSDRFFTETYATTEGGFSAGGGVRVPLGSGWYVAPEFRIGWEPHTRFHVAVGKRF